MAEAVYGFCALASLFCTGLLIRSYLRNRVPLLFWTTICFVGLAISNIILVIDLVVIDHIDFYPYRTISMLIGLMTLIYGLITDRTGGRLS